MDSSFSSGKRGRPLGFSVEVSCRVVPLPGHQGKRSRRGRPPAILSEKMWGPYQDIAFEVHLWQRKYPDAKLDAEIVPRVARRLGISTRRVWRALKNYETMHGTREPVRVDPFLESLHDHCARLKRAGWPKLTEKEKADFFLESLRRAGETEMADLFLTPAQPETEGMVRLREMQAFHDSYFDMVKELDRALAPLGYGTAVDYLSRE
jgi:hypothetical protein